MAFPSRRCGRSVLDALGIMLKVLRAMILAENWTCWHIRVVKWHSGTNNVREWLAPGKMLEVDLIFVRVSH